MSEDPCEAICDALVSWANALSEAGSLGFGFAASKPEDINAEIEYESPDLKVLFFPYGSTEQKIGRGGQCLEQFMVDMYLIRRLSSEFNRARLASLVRTIRVAARGVRQAGYVWSGSSTETEFDPERFANLNLFVNVTRFTYTGAG